MGSSSTSSPPKSNSSSPETTSSHTSCQSSDSSPTLSQFSPKSSSRADYATSFTSQPDLDHDASHHETDPPTASTSRLVPPLDESPPSRPSASRARPCMKLDFTNIPSFHLHSSPSSSRSLPVGKSSPSFSPIQSTLLLPHKPHLSSRFSSDSEHTPSSGKTRSSPNVITPGTQNALLAFGISPDPSPPNSFLPTPPDPSPPILRGRPVKRKTPNGQSNLLDYKSARKLFHNLLPGDRSKFKSLLSNSEESPMPQVHDTSNSVNPYFLGAQVS